jgi:hypothetical protein
MPGKNLTVTQFNVRPLSRKLNKEVIKSAKNYQHFFGSRFEPGIIM